MNNNKSGGIGRILILLVIVGISFFIVKNVGVDNITKKANNALDSVLSKSSEQLNNLSSKEEENIDYNSKRPYKNHNQEVLDGLKNNIKEYDKNRGDFTLKDFKKDNKYSLISDEYAKNWKDFDNNKCTTYKAALITLGENVETDDKCNIIKGSWKDQYVNTNDKESKKDEESKTKDNDDKKTTSITAKKKNKNSDIDDRDYHNFVVDNVVPLENIWDSGYGNTDMGMRMGSANDRINMMITTPNVNKDKGVSTIDEWTPEKDSDHYCDYADRYGLVKLNYSLNVTQSEYDTLEHIYSTCNNEQK